MNKNLQAIQTPLSAYRQIPKWALLAIIAGIVSRRWLFHHADADATLRTVVALAPVPIWFMWARSAVQRLHLRDEMHQLITYKAWFFAGLGTMFVMMALRQVQLAGLQLPEQLSHGLDCESIFLLMGSLVIVGFIWFNRRYQ